VEASLVAGPGQGSIAGECAKRQNPGAAWDLTLANYAPAITAQIGNAVAALACDITRVVTLQLDCNGSRLDLKPLLPALTQDTDHHGIAHSGAADSESNLALIDAWYAKHLATLIDRMNRIPEGNGTMLDHSVVVWLHEQGRGSNHQRYDHTAILAGSQNGFFKAGTVVDLRTGEKVVAPRQNNGSQTVDKGQPLPRLLMSLAESMGAAMDPAGPFGGAAMSPDEKSFFAAGALAELR
jgi:hypothetical protein